MAIFNSNVNVENHILKTKKVVLDINAGTSGFNCSNIPDVTVTAVSAGDGTYTIDCTQFGNVYRCWEVRAISDTDTCTYTASVTSNVLSIAADSADDLSATHQDAVLEITYEVLV